MFGILKIEKSKYTKKQIEKFRKKGLYPCTYCQKLTDYITCPRCGQLEDEGLGKC